MTNNLSALVFLDIGGKEPYTTDEIVSQCAQVRRSTVMRLIRNHQKDLEEFGRLGFEIRPLQTKGGMQDVKLYHLNEQQATLLITYLRNTEPVIDFKKALVHEFFTMRAELERLHTLRTEGKPTRRTLTDLIRDNPNHSKWDYKLFTDLAYRAAFGKSAAQLRKERGIEGKRSIDLLSTGELEAYQKQEAAVAVLYGVGVDYQTIKSVLLGSTAAFRA